MVHESVPSRARAALRVGFATDRGACGGARAAVRRQRPAARALARAVEEGQLEAGDRRSGLRDDRAVLRVAIPPTECPLDIATGSAGSALDGGDALALPAALDTPRARCRAFAADGGHPYSPFSGSCEDGDGPALRPRFARLANGNRCNRRSEGGRSREGTHAPCSQAACGAREPAVSSAG